MPSRTWFMLAAIWIVGALAWFAWTDAGMATNAAVLQSRESAALWNRFFVHDCLWALLPALGLLMLGSVVAAVTRRRR